MSGLPTVEAVAFPGQGVDPVDTVRILDEHRGHPLLAVLSEVTGRGSWTPEDLLDTTVAQPCLVAAGLLSAERLSADSDWSADPPVVLGHSLGEITALAHVGAIEPADSLVLVRRRAELGRAADERRPGRMISVMKLDDIAVEWVRRCAVAHTGGALDVAVVNAPRHHVLSGDRETADHAVDLAFEAGGVARRLSIGGAYHTPFLVDVVPEYEVAVAAAVRADPRVPMIGATCGRVETAPEAVAALARALVLPARWDRAVRAAAAAGVHGLVDAGPGATLATMAKHDPVLLVRALREA